MKVVIFAGGSGKRFWPLSRRDMPKQFKPLIDGRSTIEIITENVAKQYGWDNIYMPTTKVLAGLVEKTFPKLPRSNIIVEPARRDLGAAVGLAMMHMQASGSGSEPVGIFWSDSYPSKLDVYLQTLKDAENLIRENGKRLILLGEQPTFPNENIGWIKSGARVQTSVERDDLEVYERDEFKYRPDLETAKEWVKDPSYTWNTGYFVSTADFVLDEYKKNAPDIYSDLKEIADTIGTDSYEETLERVYPLIDVIHYDHIVLENLSSDKSLVLKTDFGWTDPGTLYAFKQFLEESPDSNVEKGQVYAYDTTDTLLYNEVEGQAVTAVGLDGFVIVNTPDALLVCHKDKVGDIKKMLEEFKEDPDLENLL